ncbi:MAG: phenylpyruvate tautomerase MIF-related protein, partial [Prochlorococcaceae cyanobacterium]
SAVSRLAMPLLSIRTSAPAPAAADLDGLLREISGRIATHLGKPEAYVMTAFEGDVAMTFAGSGREPVAYLELKSVGRLSPESTAAISADLCGLIEERLAVPAARTYIEFAAAEGYLWGWNRRTFG